MYSTVATKETCIFHYLSCRLHSGLCCWVFVYLETTNVQLNLQSRVSFSITKRNKEWKQKNYNLRLHFFVSVMEINCIKRGKKKNCCQHKVEMDTITRNTVWAARRPECVAAGHGRVPSAQWYWYWLLMLQTGSYSNRVFTGPFMFAHFSHSSATREQSALLWKFTLFGEFHFGGQIQSMSEIYPWGPDIKKLKWIQRV